MKYIVFIFLLTSSVFAQDSLRVGWNYKPYTFREYKLPVYSSDTLTDSLRRPRGYTLEYSKSIPERKQNSWDKATQTLGIQNVPQWFPWVVFVMALLGGLSIIFTIVR